MDFEILPIEWNRPDRILGIIGETGTEYVAREAEYTAGACWADSLPEGVQALAHSYLIPEHYKIPGAAVKLKSLLRGRTLEILLEEPVTIEHHGTTQKYYVLACKGAGAKDNPFSDPVVHLDKPVIYPSAYVSHIDWEDDCGRPFGGSTFTCSEYEATTELLSGTEHTPYLSVVRADRAVQQQLLAQLDAKERWKSVKGNHRLAQVWRAQRTNIRIEDICKFKSSLWDCVKGAFYQLGDTLPKELAFNDAAVLRSELELIKQSGMVLHYTGDVYENRTIFGELTDFEQISRVPYLPKEKRLNADWSSEKLFSSRLILSSACFLDKLNELCQFEKHKLFRTYFPTLFEELEKVGEILHPVISPSQLFVKKGELPWDSIERIFSAAFGEYRDTHKK